MMSKSEYGCITKEERKPFNLSISKNFFEKKDIIITNKCYSNKLAKFFGIYKIYHSIVQSEPTLVDDENGGSYYEYTIKISSYTQYIFGISIITRLYDD